MKSALVDRESWPFPTLLPWSVMYNYPPPQFMKSAANPRPEEWPPRGSTALREWGEETASFASPLDQIYVHVPFCPFVCDFCPFYKIKGPTPGLVDGFVESLIEEIRLYRRNPFASRRKFSVIYFGGGTPTELSPDQIGRILGELRETFDLADEIEITLEGVARHLLADGYLEKCVAHGINRISFGIQSLDGRVRAAIGRDGDRVEDYPAAIERARSIAPNLPVNVELMHGCPEQSDESFLSDVRACVDWSPASIDLFSYIMMPGTSLYRKVVRGEIAEPRYGEHLLRQRKEAKMVLEEAGFRQVAGEMFKRDDRGLFSSSFYGGRGNGLHVVLPLGPSAIGHMEGTAFRNVSDLKQYGAMVREGVLPIASTVTMTRDQVRLRAILLAVAHLDIPKHLIEKPREKRAISRWMEHGLVQAVGDSYRVTPAGTHWYNQMQMELLPPWDFLRNISLLGSLEEQAAFVLGGTALGRELLAMAGAYGGLPTTMTILAYKTYLRFMARLPRRWSGGVGWFGPVKQAIKRKVLQRT